MRSLCSAILLFVSIYSMGSTTVKPTTTLVAETANNTSAADGFAGLPNGNIPAGNVSKAPLRSLLYPGATTKIYVHLMPWFGGKNHVSVGYDSADPAQATRQVADMVSRGADGTIIDWYGQFNTRPNTASLNVLHAAEQNANFEVALMEDIGAVNTSADPTQKTIDDLTYAWSAFMQSPAYMRRDGHPVVFFFGFEGSGVDMAKVKADVPGNPLFVFRNNGGFTVTASDGGFAWLATRTSSYENYMSLGYLDSFYGTALKNAGLLTFGSGFKGFDDTIAAWSPVGGRHIPQMCGQTWLRSMAEAGLYYSATKQLENLQIVTWNDYEEGTALESGVDNCVTVTASVAGDTLNWTVTGDEGTLDRYVLFVSADGQDLMPFAEVPAGTHAHDLKQYELDAGSYTVFVKAIGRASIRNQMSGPAAYTVATAPPPPQGTSDWKMSLAPNSATMTPVGTTKLSLALQPTTTSFNSAVTLQCGNLPANLRCDFSSESVTPGGGTTVTLTLTSVQTTATKRGSPMLLATSLFGVLGLFASGSMRRRTRWFIAAGALAVGLAMAGCGGGQTTAISTPSTPSTSSTVGVKPGAYTITVTGISGTTERNASATLIVQ